MVSLIAYTTYAVLTAQGKTQNVITTGNVRIKLYDTAFDGDEEVSFPAQGIEIMPSRTVTKMVYVENTGGNPCYVRIKLDTSVTFENQEDYVEPSEDIMMNIDSENWLNGNDGYYYYKKELLPGSFTEKLFDEVEFSKNMGNEYQGATISISVSAEAVQSENNSIGQGQSILEVKGWPGEPQTILPPV